MQKTGITAVPTLNLKAGFAAQREELLAELQEVAESGYYVLGPKVEQFEAALREYNNAKFALALSSGTDAHLAGMMAMGIGPGDEVIVPAFTFFATAGCVSRLGATPVFCDIDPVTYNLNPKAIEAAITKHTKAIAPVHLYGQLADMRTILAIGKKNNIPVIEDAAQAIGANDDELGFAGAIGHFGWLSFYPTKNLGAMGDAGALLTNNEEFYELCRKIRVHGSGHTYFHDVVGGNFRIDAIQAALLTIKMKRLEEVTEQRRDRAHGYTQRIQAAGLDPEFVETPREKFGRHVYHQYILRAKKRDDLMTHLREKNIGCGIYYPLPLHMQKCFAYLEQKEGSLPESERAANEVLGLPIYPELSDDQLDYVVAAIAEFYQH
ncbi:MAG: DegT/DnrJ/EryC1/StrS family aminotransferase [Phycisphaerae bacterium]